MADRQVIDSEALNQCVTKYKEALERLLLNVNTPEIYRQALELML